MLKFTTSQKQLKNYIISDSLSQCTCLQTNPESQYFLKNKYPQNIKVTQPQLKQREKKLSQLSYNKLLIKKSLKRENFKNISTKIDSHRSPILEKVGQMNSQMKHGSPKIKINFSNRLISDHSSKNIHQFQNKTTQNQFYKNTKVIKINNSLPFLYPQHNQYQRNQIFKPEFRTFNPSQFQNSHNSQFLSKIEGLTIPQESSHQNSSLEFYQLQNQKSDELSQTQQKSQLKSIKKPVPGKTLIKNYEQRFKNIKDPSKSHVQLYEKLGNQIDRGYSQASFSKIVIKKSQQRMGLRKMQDVQQIQSQGDKDELMDDQQSIVVGRLKQYASVVEPQIQPSTPIRYNTPNSTILNTIGWIKGQNHQTFLEQI